MYKRRNNSEIKFIAIDWGSSNFRAYAVDKEGNVRQRTKAHQGVLRIKDGNFAGILKRLLGKWFNKYPGIPLLMLGMIGSEHGWQDVEYTEAPINAEGLARYVEKIYNHRFDRDIYVIPGVKAFRDNHVSFDEVRGEEVQVFGALEQQPTATDEHHYICCPGSHSKWVDTHNDSICNIHTFMTGELFSLLSRNSVLATYMEASFTDPEAFKQGLRLSEKQDALLADLYTVHTEGMAEQIGRTSLSSYLSGILIGHEIKSAKKIFSEMKTLTLVGAPWLMEMYQQACQFYQLDASLMKSDHALVAGLVEIYRHMSLPKKASKKSPQAEVNYNF